MGDRVQPAFLLSLPRSGSTLLQRMLGAHPQVATRAEPWLLLPLFSALTEDGVYTKYNHRVAHRAVGAFVDTMPDGEETYYRQVNRFAMGFYEAAANSGERIFLDKTPRYGLYLPSLLRAFPDAPMIVLWRNPLAVVASIIDTWLHGRWMPYLHTVDLYDLLESMCAAITAEPDRFHQLRYEDVVEDPLSTVPPVLDHLHLRWADQVVFGFTSTDVEGTVGDKSGVRTYTTGVSAASLRRWRASFASPLRKAWARRYLAWIGDERLALMGYSRTALLGELESIPTQRRTLASDVALTGKGIAWKVLEPQIFRDKWAAPSQGRRITSHS